MCIYIYIYIYIHVYTYTYTNIYTHIMKPMCPPAYHHNGFVVAHTLEHVMYIMCPSACVVAKPLW